jgi:hypothetical protein
MKNAVFWDIRNPVRTSQETHYVSATESTRLMLCKIWGFYGGDCKECRLLGYKNPIRSSQETHNFSATETSRLMLCKIWGFHGSDYEECLLDVTPCGSGKNRRFGGTYLLHHQGDKNQQARNNALRLLVTANVPSSPIVVTLRTEAIRSSESSVLTRSTRRNIQKTTFFIVTAVKTSHLT